MSTYYRFRPAERLLGRPACGDAPARSGELDELTIYFASPQELNDPLEGHRETYFEGDLIVWRNLIKHYTLTLYASVVSVYVDGGEGEIEHVNLRPENFIPETRDVVMRIIESVGANPILSTYIETLAGTFRKVGRTELAVHLMTLHNPILSHVLNGLAEHFELPDAARYRSVQKSFHDFIALRAVKIEEEGSSPDLSLYKELRSKIKQQALRGNAARELELSKGAMRIYVNFPEEFARQIDYLIYPNWYVACFMESCSSPAIWGSYGDNHRGICLIYETQKNRGVDCLRFKQLPWDFVRAINYGRPKNEWYLSMECPLPLIKVKYNSKFTSTNFFTSLLGEDKNWLLSYWYSDGVGTSACATCLDGEVSESFEQYRKLYEQSITTKTNHWQNEAERRVIISGFPYSPDERQVKYNFYDLHGIVFGINTPDEVKVKVIRKIALHCEKHRRSDFKFYQARFDEAYDKIEHDHLEYIRFNQDGSLNVDANMS